MKKALFIGINYYGTISQLNGCIDDVVNMRNILVDAFGFSMENIVILREDASIPGLLPTKQNILTQLQTLVADSENCTEIWFHYSGHGSQIRDKNGDEKEDLDEIIVPLDYTTAGSIIDDDLYAILKQTKCKTVLIFDSCHSGTVVDLPWSYIYVDPGAYQVVRNNNNTLENTEIFMFSGSKDDQTSADTYSADQRQAVGAFTNAFISSIRARNHEVTFLTLYRDICILLSKTGFSQIPVFSSATDSPHFVLSRTAEITNYKIEPVILDISATIFTKIV